MPKKSETGKEKKSAKISMEEFEKKVLELARSGLTSEKIGEKLRKEGIHPKEFGRKISQILIEKNEYINPDLKNVGDKLNRIVKHYGKNKQDKRSMREKDRIFSQLRKLKKYFEVK
jgi:ribosomal protein S15P/S13E